MSPEMTQRQQEILRAAIDIIANEGYAALSMRALARANCMKLGALQYHFRTAEELMRNLVQYIESAYEKSFEALRQSKDPLDLSTIVEFLLDDAPGKEWDADRLWPQLWAMQQVEPLVSDLVEDLYGRYINELEAALKQVGSQHPRAEALALMSMLEGSTVFLGRGRRWHADATEVRAVLLDNITRTYSKPNKHNPGKSQ